MGDSIDQDGVDKIVKFVSDNDERVEILERIVEYEQNNPPSKTFKDKDGVDASSWEVGEDVKMLPGYIGQFKNAPFINILFDSNSATVMCLDNLQAAEEALQQMEDEADRWSDEWFEEQLGGNKVDQRLASVDVTDEKREEIEEIVNDVDCLEYWSQYIAPTLKHRDKAKKIVLIMLASPEDKNGTKGRVNMLAYGPPGTGKSVIKNYLVSEFEAESIDGPRVSKADITYNKSSDEFGQLPKAHKGVLVVEESDEMDNAPLGAALTSLGESGKIEIRDREIPAEAQGVFLSNFDTVDHAINQWSKEAVNRFDFKVHFDRLSEELKDETIDWHYKYFRQPKPRENEDLLFAYLKMCRSYHPEIAELDEISEFKSERVEEFTNIRQGLSVMNIAWIIARLNLSDVKLTHYKQAYELLCG